MDFEEKIDALDESIASWSRSKTDNDTRCLFSQIRLLIELLHLRVKDLEAKQETR